MRAKTALWVSFECSSSTGGERCGKGRHALIGMNESDTAAIRIVKATINVLGWLMVVLAVFVIAILDLAKKTK